MNYTELEYNYAQIFRRIFLATSDYEIIDSRATVDGVPVRKLFVNNLAQRSTYKDLQKCFSTYGGIESCYLRRNNNKKNNYAFVTFYKTEDANRALENGISKQIRLHNRDLKVLPANSWHQPDNIKKRLRIMRETNCEEGKVPPNLRGDAVKCIFPYLSFKDRLRMEEVCTVWRDVGITRGAWRDTKLSLISNQWIDVHIPSLRTSSFREILMRCGIYLKEIDLSHPIHDLGLSTVSVIANLCPQLETLDLSGVTISSSSLDMLAYKCKEVKKLTLGITLGTCDTELRNIFYAMKLKYVAFKRTSFIGRCLLYLELKERNENAKSKQKQETEREQFTLIVEGCKELKDTHFSKALGNNLQLLNHLGINYCPYLRKMTIEAISNCINLKSLELTSVFKDEPTEAGMPPPLETLLLKLSDLRVLTLIDIPGLTVMFFQIMSERCKNLTSVAIIDCMNVKNTHVQFIRQLQHLESLILNKLTIDDAGLAGIRTLKHFECRRCISVTSEGIIEVINGSPNLQVLDVSGCAAVRGNILKVANDMCASRDDQSKLKVYVGATGINKDDHPQNQYPWLSIIHADLSDLGSYKPVNAQRDSSQLDEERVSDEEVAFDEEHAPDEEQISDEEHVPE